MLADDDELSPHRDPFLKNFLEEERHRVGGATEERKVGLRSLIEVRESELVADNEMSKLFENYIVTLPAAERPQSARQKYRLYGNWEDDLRRELADWKAELSRLEAQTLDGQLVYDSAKHRLLRLLESEARGAGLLQQPRIRETPPVTPVQPPSLKADRRFHPTVPVDRQPESKNPRRRKGQLTPMNEYIRPILESLVEMGGSARSGHVLRSVNQKMETKLNDYDLQAKPSQPSEPYWRNRANWCRLVLIREYGFLRSDSPRGYWEITGSGRRYLEDLNQGSIT